MTRAGAPTRTETQRAPAHAHIHRDDVDAGIELLTTGLRLNPAFPEVYNNLANFLRDKVRACVCVCARARSRVCM